MAIDQTSPDERATGTDPVWARAAAMIEGEIHELGLRPGSRLESERALCERLSVSRVTLRKALGTLVEAGVVTPSHGRGWFVGSGSPPRRTDWPNTLESFTETAERKGLVASSRVLRCVVEPATIDEAEQLRIAPGSPLHHFDRVRLLGGVAIGRDRSRIPADLMALDPGKLVGGSLFALLTTAGLAPLRAETTIEAHHADDELALDLEILPGDPVLVMDQLVTAADGRAVLASLIEYAGDRYRLRTTFARAGDRTGRLASQPGGSP